MHKLKLPITATFSLLFLWACNSEKIELQYNLTPGQKYTLDMDMEMQMDVLSNVTDMDMNMFLTIEVADQRENEITLNNTYESIHVRRTIPGLGTVEYNSASEDTWKGLLGEELAAAFEPVLGKTFTIKMDRHGQVTEMSGINGRINTPRVQGDNDVTSYLQNFFVRFPDHPVGVRDSWNREIRLEQDIPLLYNNRYTITDITDDEVHIRVRGDIQKDESGHDHHHHQESNFLSSFNGTTRGTMIIDRKSGWTRNADFEQTLHIEAIEGDITTSGTIVTNIKFTSR